MPLQTSPTSWARHWRHAVALLAVFLLKCAVLSQLMDHVLLQEDAGLDTSAYLQLARRVVAGDLWLGPGLYYVSPLYIYFAALVLWITDSTLAIRLLQIALGTASVALVFVAANVWFGRTAAWVSATFAALTGLFTFYEVLLLQAALDPVLTSGALAALALALRHRRTSYAVLTGILWGLQAMNRPNVVGAAVVVIALVAASGRRRSAAAVLAGLLLAVSPLLVRNGIVAGQWVVLTSHGGLNLYVGNHEAADGTYKAVDGIAPNIAGQQEDARRVAGAALGRPVNDAEASAYFAARARRWIAGHPVAAARLLIRKLHLVVSAEHLWLNYSYPFFARDTSSLLAALLAGPWLLFPLGIAGLLLAPREPEGGYWLWSAFVPLYAVSVAVFFVSERYRLPLLPPMCVGAGALLVRLMEWLRSGESRALVRAAVLVGTAAAISNWPLGLDDGRTEQRLRMAETLIRRSRFEEARRWADEVVARSPTPALAHFRIARALAAAGQPTQALPHLEMANRLDPGRAEVSYALGQALLDAGRPADAVAPLRSALAAGVRSDVTGFDLARALAATGDRQGALDILRQITPASEGDSASWYALGQLAEQLASPALAADRYRRAAAAAPLSAEPRERYGLMLALIGDFEAAAEQLHLATKAAPRDASIRLNLAVALARLGKMDEARQEAREALRLEPEYQKAKDLLHALSK